MKAWLEDRAVIALSGPDARSFLQGLITNDAEKLPAYAALLTPQGKMLFDFLLSESGEDIIIDCLAGIRDTLAKRLSMYRLRAKVQIAARDDLAVAAAWDGDADGSADPRLAALGTRAIVAKAEAPAPGAAVYLAHRLTLGVPEGTDFGQDRMFALDAGLDELHAVAFGKGCYVGQELTARMKHRGTARKRLLVVETKDGTALPARDTAVTAGGKSIGEIEAVYVARGFALIRLDRLADAADTPLEAAGVPVRVSRQAWLGL